METNIWKDLELTGSCCRVEVISPTTIDIGHSWPGVHPDWRIRCQATTGNLSPVYQPPFREAEKHVRVGLDDPAIVQPTNLKQAKAPEAKAGAQTSEE